MPTTALNPAVLNINAPAFVPASFTKSHTLSLEAIEHPPVHSLALVDKLDLLGLPCEVISSVLSRLSSPKDVASAILACKELMRHVHNCCLSLDLSGAVLGASKDEVLRNLPKYMPGTVSLVLPSLGLDDEDVAALNSRLPRLHLLDVSGTRKLTSTGSAALLSRSSSGMAALRVLNLQRCFQLGASSLDEALISSGSVASEGSLQAVCLSHLDLGRWLPQGQASADAMSQLRILALHNCMRLAAPALLSLATACGGSVRYLLLGGGTLAAVQAVPDTELPAAATEHISAAFPRASNSESQQAQSAVALALVAMVLSMPSLEVLELTFFPPAVLAALRTVLADSRLPSRRAPIAIWDLATPAGVAAAAASQRRIAAAAIGVDSTPVQQSAGAMILRCAVNCSSARARTTPLHGTAERGDISTAGLLLALGASPDARDAGGASPLFLACEAGHAEVAALLLAHGADPLLSNAAGESPLYIASLRGHLPAVTALLRHFESRNITWLDANLYGDNWTPLMAAAVANRHDVAALLLQAARAEACLLVKHVNKYGQGPLHLAARKGSAKLLRLLLEVGGRTAVSVADTSGETPIDVAKRNRHVLALCEFRKACATA